MPIETTAAGILDIENAKLRASELMATISLGIGTDSQADIPFKIKTDDPAVWLQEGTSTSAGKLLAKTGVLHIQSGTAFTNDSKGDIAFSSIGDVTRHMTIVGSTGNVGIGTANPQSQLHVKNGDISISQDYRIKGLRSDNTEAGYIISNSEGWKIGENRGGSISEIGVGYDRISFSCGGERMRITSGGNVGIGATNPTTKLYVNGDIQIPHTAFLRAGGPDNFTHDGVSMPHYGLLWREHTSETGALLMQLSGYHGFKLFTLGSERVSINKFGYVGIGTTSPGAPLAVASTRNADTWAADKSQFDVLNNNGSGSFYGMSFAVSQSRGDGIIQTFNRTTGTATYDLCLQPNAGNVGIGTTDPTQKLDVNGNVRQRGANTYLDWTERRIIMNYDSTYRQGIQFSAGTREMTLFSTTGDSGGSIIFKTRAGGGSSDTDYGTERMRITGGGNVGIGTTSPMAKLEVAYTEGDYSTMAFSNTSTWHDKGIRITGGSGGFVYGFDVNHSVFMRRSPTHTYADANSYISPIEHKFYTGGLVGASGLNIRANINDTGLQVTGTITATSSITPNSDDRIKYNEEDIPNALDTIGKLKPQKYEKIIDTIDKEGTWIPTDQEWENVRNDYTYINEFGFIAQDVRNIPELAFLVKGEEITPILHTISQQMHSNLTTEEQTSYTPKYTRQSEPITQEEFSILTSEEREECVTEYTKYVDTQTPLSIDYNGIFVVAIGAIQELKSKNDTLETQLASVLARLDALENP
jgi:hypothetical protein